MGFARIEKVRLDHSTPPEEAQRRGSGEPVVHPTSAGREHNAHDEHQEEGSRQRHRRQPVRRRAPAHGRCPTPRDPGRGSTVRSRRPTSALPRVAPLRTVGRTSYAAMVTTTKSSDRPCVTSTCRGCRPKGSPPRSRWSSSTSTNPSAHVNVIASMRRAPRRARIEAGAGIGSASLTWPNLWRTALPWPRERLPDRRLVRRDRRSGCERLGSGGCRPHGRASRRRRPGIRWQLRLGPDGVELDRDPSTDPDIRITTDRETATEIRAGNVSAQRLSRRATPDRRRHPGTDGQPRGLGRAGAGTRPRLIRSGRGRQRCRALQPVRQPLRRYGPGRTRRSQAPERSNSHHPNR